MTSKPYYITTPIYYVNDSPHIGHAYTSIAADVLARFMRLDGRDVKFMTGTDEHGQKVEKSAAKAGMDPQSFTDQVSQRFRTLAEKAHLSNDDFIRTTEPRHRHCAQTLWQRLVDHGHIYKGSYAGWYAVRDEAFYAESELVDGKAPTGADVEWVEEPSYFFKLSAWQEPLLKFYQENPHFIGPDSRRNEVIRFVEGGLEDLSVSRSSFKWGVPVPGDDDHVMYVWIEALSNYLTVLGYPDHPDQVAHYWPEAVHLVGKDIIRFHAVYWPAFLMAAGLTPPKRVYAHGWWTNEGQKISKSLGNVIDAFELIERFGVDQVRYFLMREVPFGQDGDFSRQALVSRINSDLANDLGNLVQRVLSFVAKNAGGVVPQPGEFLQPDLKILNKAHALLPALRSLAEAQSLSKMLEVIWDLIGDANRYVDAQAPWTLRKTDEGRMKTVLYVLMDVIRHVSVAVSPFLPLGAARIMDQLALSSEERQFAALNQKLEVGRALPVPQGVFPRLDLTEAA
ncbi:MAG: methionine--tRNA ligase [Holosporales bacterium]